MSNKHIEVLTRAEYTAWAARGVILPSNYEIFISDEAVIVTGNGTTAPTEASSTGGAAIPESLTGTGAIALTHAAHAGRNWHVEPGQTSLTIAVLDWAASGELNIINHTGGDLPVTLGAGLTGYENVKGGGSVSGPGTLATVAYLERATIQVKDGAFVNVAIVGGGAPEEAWAANTRYRQGQIVRAPAVSGTIGIGDRIIRTAAGISAATFAADAANWTELAEDPDVLLTASVVNNLTSTSITAPLSAAQGKALKDTADTLATTVGTKAPLSSPAFAGTIVADGSVQLGNGQDAGTAASSDLADATTAYSPTQAGPTTTTPESVLRLVRGGTNGTKYNQSAELRIGSHTAGLNALTRIELVLANGGQQTPDTTVITFDANGQVILNSNPTAALGAVTKQYADALVAGLLDYRGAFTPAASSGATGYPTTGGSGTSGAILKGDTFVASTAGFILTEAVQTGDWVVAKQDAPGQTVANWDKLNTNISYVPADDTAVVKLTGAQTIAGAKTFSAIPILPASDPTVDGEATRKRYVDDGLAAKQDALVSGANIKSINSQSLLGSGNLAVGASSASVTTRDGGIGGTVTTVSTAAGIERIHTFTTSDNFVVPAGVSSVRYLVRGGDGGGGAGRYRGDAGGRPGGGGGAGGLQRGNSLATTPGASMAVVVGAKGLGATDIDDSDAGTGGTNGGNSSFGGITANGGGHGGGHHQTNSSPWDVPPTVGGSGGGGSNGSSGAAGIAGQGNPGGNASGTSGNGGGGGGAGGAGSSTTGAGGAGVVDDISGSSVTYSPGGVGSNSSINGHAGASSSGPGGGGGQGGWAGGSDGVAAGLGKGGDGSPGVVIVRYLYQSIDTPIYANNAAAIAGGLTLGQLYRTGADPDTLCVVH